MPVIKNSDLPLIASTYTKLVNRGDTDRKSFSNAMLTVYTPVTSALFLLSTSLQLKNFASKIAFLIISSSAALIVLTALVEKLMYLKVSDSAGQAYVDHVNETGRHLDKPIVGKDWQLKVLRAQNYILTLLLFINIIATITFIFIKVL